MLRIAVVTIVLAAAARAESAPCRLDRAHYPAGGYGEALVCNGSRLEDVWVRFERDGRITGIYWSEYQGLHRKRTTQLASTGKVTFLVEDQAIKGGFFAQSRGTSHYLFPRGGRMTVDEDRDTLRLRVRDAAGHAWELVGTPHSDTRVSYAIASIDGAAQREVPIDFTYRGIVGVDLDAAHAWYLEHKEPVMTGLADRRSRAYKTTPSIFHDGAGRTCSVANGELYVPSPADPGDKSDDVLRFATDDALADFLAATCPAISAIERSPDRSR